MAAVFLVLISFFSASKEPRYSASDIDRFVSEIKNQKKIPDKAVDIAFDFYKKNRNSTGGLKDISCIDKKDYRIRHQDPKLTKSLLKSGVENEDCVCIMDYTASKTKERGHCIFLSSQSSPVIESFLVAHGIGSDSSSGIPVKFTNKVTSTGTTLSGIHLTSVETYKFQGTAKGTGAYTSTGLSLYGMEDCNWTAARVGKATHGAPYVKEKPQNVGRSAGCPAMTYEKAKSILPRCTGKAVWLNYTTEIAQRTDTSPLSCK